MNGFEFPKISEHSATPVWIGPGSGFLVGDQKMKILSYGDHADIPGWSDALSSFHESNAGDAHFIDRASRRHALEQIVKYYGDKNDCVIMDIGCSSGFMLRDLTERFPDSFVIGSDIVREPLENLAESRSDIPLMHFDLTTCPLNDNSVDVIILLNVLEHIEDDKLALWHVFRILKPGGIAIIEVPANPDLYDIYDKMLLHYRRYQLSSLDSMVCQLGFNVLNKSHLGFLIYLPFYLVKKRTQKAFSQSVDNLEANVAQNIKSTKDSRLLDLATRLELFIGKWFAYPTGIRCLLTIQKPEN